MRIRAWAALLPVSVVLLGLAGLLAFRSPGEAVDGDRRMTCAAGIWGLLPSDPARGPDRTVSDECHTRTRVALLGAVGLTAGALAAGVAGILLAARRPRP